MTTRLLKDGALSQNAHNFEPRTALNSSSPAKYLRPSDFRIFRKIMMARGEDGYYSSAPPFMSDDGFELLQDILATNRARWLEVTGMALSPGPPREGKISWDAAKGDELQLRLDVGDGIPRDERHAAGLCRPEDGADRENRTGPFAETGAHAGRGAARADRRMPRC